MPCFQIDGGNPEQLNEALRNFRDECKNPKEEMMYCKYCKFKSDDDLECDKHFKETGHNQFLPENLLHERVFSKFAVEKQDVEVKG